MKCVAAIALVMMAATSPASAQTNATPTPAPAKEERKICRRMEQTGSRMGGGQRICHTAAEWQQLEMDSVTRNVNGAGNMRGNGRN